MATAKTTTVVVYDGTNLGKIYLRDIGGRNQLGNGQGIFSYGQDQYLSYGQDATFQNTSDVIMSVNQGVIKTYDKASAASGLQCFTVSQV